MCTTFHKPSRPLTWLITGCSSGLGLELTRAIQHEGHVVIATSRQPARTPELVAEVEGHGGQWHALDVEDPTAAATLIDSLESSGTQIDVLINNAGSIIFGAVEQLSDKELRRQMEVLYFGPSRLIHAVLPRMRQRRLGIIVNISSGAALDGRDSMGGYAAGKGALDASSRVLAKEVTPFNVRLLTVWLGTFRTNFGNASQFSEGPLPDDYRGSVAENMMDAIKSGKFVGDGDTEKAAKAILEVVLGQGAGTSLEAERFLPLGRDMLTRVGLVRDQCGHALEVFGDICGNVYAE
ncbi:Short-chain dehydrogenase/reductase SDR [Penicillium macrosclerotiorum]|uniref:Short-chain dehydrogenase/reductase SDR n=1 Tax=Penicillium macrosclerotiorum TaxID=303699 RepID=UPI002547594D|nr:Short-chain dehydrogenase/reductase SDR [Penicillium macrosclerotiorum]KAJ5693075.1 Short-chain dehydrogenase/reductase SDR [Penicillium macrosclerotiorum]